MDNQNIYHKYEANKTKNSRHMKHGLFMLICCLLPIVLVAALPILGIKGGVLSSIIFLLCPLLHLAMMLSMRNSGDGKSCCATNKTSQE